MHLLHQSTSLLIKLIALLDFDLSQNDIVTIFNQLGFDTEINDDVITVLVPSRRKDITIKEDLIEEVARIYGYDDIPSTLPVFDKVTSGQLTDRQYKTRMVKRSVRRCWIRPSYYVFVSF